MKNDAQSTSGPVEPLRALKAGMSVTSMTEGALFRA